LKRIKETGDIFFAISDRGWILDGANVHISMVGFDSGAEAERTLDGRPVQSINPNLGRAAGIANAERLVENSGAGFIGVAQKAPFDVSLDQALSWLSAANPSESRTATRCARSATLRT